MIRRTLLASLNGLLWKNSYDGERSWATAVGRFGYWGEFGKEFRVGKNLEESFGLETDDELQKIVAHTNRLSGEALFPT